MPTKSLSLEEIAQEDDQTRLLTELQTSRTGLTKDEVTRRQAQDGPNVLKQIKGASWLTKFTQNFTSMMAILLWVAGAIAFVAQLEELGIAIWLVNIINGLFSFWQEYQAGKETDALSKMLPSYSGSCVTATTKRYSPATWSLATSSSSRRAITWPPTSGSLRPPRSKSTSRP